MCTCFACDNVVCLRLHAKFLYSRMSHVRGLSGKLLQEANKVSCKADRGISQLKLLHAGINHLLIDEADATNTYIWTWNLSQGQELPFEPLLACFSESFLTKHQPMKWIRILCCLVSHPRSSAGLSIWGKPRCDTLRKFLGRPIQHRKSSVEAKKGLYAISMTTSSHTGDSHGVVTANAVINISHGTETIYC